MGDACSTNGEMRGAYRDLVGHLRGGENIYNANA